MASAQSSTDPLQIMGEVLPVQLEQQGAQAAGIPLNRYRQVHGAVTEVLGKRSMGAATTQMMGETDTTHLSPEQRAQVRENMRQMQAAWGDPYAGLTPETAEAIRARADELAQLHAELMGMMMGVGR